MINDIKKHHIISHIAFLENVESITCLNLMHACIKVQLQLHVSLTNFVVISFPKFGGSRIQMAFEGPFVRLRKSIWSQQ